MYNQRNLDCIETNWIAVTFEHTIEFYHRTSIRSWTFRIISCNQLMNLLKFLILLRNAFFYPYWNQFDT